MKQFLTVLLFVLVSVSVSGNDWFPINAWGIRRTTSSVREVKEDWNGNSTKIWLGDCNENTIELLLEEGADCDTVYFIPQDLKINSSHITLTDIAKSQFSTYESECHDDTYSPPGYFADSCVGEFVDDPTASNDTAWAAYLTTHEAGYMQLGLTQSFSHRQEYLIYQDVDTLINSLRYEARFHLRISGTRGEEDDTVCILEVWRENTLGAYHKLASRILLRSNFTDTLTYEPFSLWFTKDTSMATSGKRDGQPMDYRIYWYDRWTLFADRVEVRDTIFWNLEEGNYDLDIQNIVAKWDTFPALKYYYLWDEPYQDQFESFHLIQEKLFDIDAKPPITTVSHVELDYSNYSKFINTCISNVSTPLIVDKYLLKPNDDSVTTIQSKFDDLCNWMDNVRAIADTTGTVSRNVWYICQAHKYINSSGITSLRDPTPNEMWALAGLGLAHGAKGILYFTYASRYYDNNPGSVMFHGLVDWHGGDVRKPNGKWDATQALNAVLQKTDEFLLDFEFQNAFSGDNLQDYIEYSSLNTLDSLSEFGLFEDSDNLKYFLIVNRTDDYYIEDTTYSPQEPTLVTLGLDGSMYSARYYLRDCYSGEAYSWDSTGSVRAPDRVYFSFNLHDCHFKLFQIVPFSSDVEINDGSSYTDYPFAKVRFSPTTNLNIDYNSSYMTVWSNEGDTLYDVPYDTTLIWQFQSPGQKIITTSFKLFSQDYIQADSGYLTPQYCDTIFLDTVPPTFNSLEKVLLVSNKIFY